jgi:hypothetical protein
VRCIDADCGTDDFNADETAALDHAREGVRGKYNDIEIGTALCCWFPDLDAARVAYLIRLARRERWAARKTA